MAATNGQNLHKKINCLVNSHVSQYQHLATYFEELYLLFSSLSINPNSVHILIYAAHLAKHHGPRGSDARSHCESDGSLATYKYTYIIIHTCSYIKPEF